MKKNTFLYRVFKHIKNPGEYHKLTIVVQTTASYDDGEINFTWQGNPEDENPKWYACNVEIQFRGRYSMLPLVSKIAKHVHYSSTPEEVIEFLDKSNVQHGTYLSLRKEDSTHYFDGLVTLSEISKGSFMRYGTKKFTIDPYQQAGTLTEMFRELDVTIPVKRRMEISSNEKQAS